MKSLGLEKLDADSPASLAFDRVVTLGASELDTSLYAEWLAIWRAQPALESPYFHPAFTHAAAAVRGDTEIAVFYCGDRRLGILPYHRLRQQCAIPIGGQLNDYHGVVSREPLAMGGMNWLSACGIRRWEFHAWQWPRLTARNLQSHHPVPTCWADLAGSAADYLQYLQSKHGTIKRQGQKRRKLVRECGPLRFEVDERDPRMLDWLIGQKRAKYQRTGCTDYFAPAWTREMIHRLGGRPVDGLRGLLSVLYCGPRPIAAHFGMLAGRTLHYWFPVYDPAYRTYSPGTELYLRIASEVEAFGIQRIDFGYGEEAYKERLATGRGQVGRGAWDTRWLHRQWTWTLDSVTAKLKKSRWRNVVRNACRSVLPNLGKPVIR